MYIVVHIAYGTLYLVSSCLLCRGTAGRKHVRVALHVFRGQELAVRGRAVPRKHHAAPGLPAVGAFRATAQHQPAFQGEENKYKDNDKKEKRDEGLVWGWLGRGVAGEL